MNDFLKEKELLLDSIENNTPEHWKNYYKDVPIECIYDDLVIDINEIKRLQQENQQLEEKLKLFEIKLEDIENVDFENGMIQKIARKYSDEYDLKRLELVLNENIITAKDKFTGIHSYMGMKVSLEPLEKNISFIVRPTSEPTYAELQQENQRLKEKINGIMEERDYLFNKLSIENKYLQQENKILKGEDNNV